MEYFVNLKSLIERNYPAVGLKMYGGLILMILLAGLLPASVYAGWSEDMRLTTRGYEFYPQIIARNDTVHVAWETIIGTDYISYMNSHDGGNTWSDLINLNQVDHLSGRLDFAGYGSKLLSIWYDIDTTGPGNSVRNIAYSISIDAGESWSVPLYVFEDGFEGLTDLAGDIQGNSIFIIYYSIVSDSTGYYPLRFLYSTNLGQSWSERRTIGYGYGGSTGLVIRKCQNTIYAVWSISAVPPNVGLEVYLAMSFDWGQTWSDVYQLSSRDYYISQDVCIGCDENTGYVVVGWMEAGYPGDLCLRITTNMGTTWGDIHQATTHHQISSPNLVIAGDTIWVAWTDHDPNHGTNNREIAFSKSINLGCTWSPHERLTYAEGMSRAPWLDYDNGKLHMVWWERHRPPYQGHDIYYKRWEPTTDVSEGIGGLKKSELSVYPNPFNSSILLNYSNLKGGEINIYDIQGKLIKTFSVEGGENGKINWDATDALGERVSSGIYFAKAKTSGGNRAVKLIYLK